MQSPSEATYKIDSVSPPRETSSSRVSLLFTWGDAARAVALGEGEMLVLGRSPPAQLVIDHRSLSRTHARLSLRDGRVTLEDLGSTNGCLLNGAPVSAATLTEDDVAQLGAVELRICAQTRHQQRLAAVSHAAFMRAVRDEIARARAFGRCVSVIALRHEEHASAHQALQASLNAFDRLCSYAPTVTLLLLPEQDCASARRWLERLRWLQSTERRAAVAGYPSVACTAGELVSCVLDACHVAPPGSIQAVEAPSASIPQGPVLLSPCMLRLYDLVARAARTTLHVLVQGETGSGKELIARAVHDKSPRSQAAFKALNCATIPANLLESVLFGHERGAFTGAERQLLGVFEQARGGTVFLDEIGELSPHAQAALLRVLEQRCIVRVGGTKEIEVDARVVAATHRDLVAMVEAGSFREDLLFRLDALTLRVPPLRERKEEIVPLAELFLARASTEWGASAQRLSEDACDALRLFPWPGNVRQLKNVIERAVAVCAGDTVELEDLPDRFWSGGDRTAPAPLRETPQAGDDLPLPDRLREFETTLLRQALQRAGGNQSRAARSLGLPRRTFAYKLHMYGLAGSTAE